MQMRMSMQPRVRPATAPVRGRTALRVVAASRAATPKRATLNGKSLSSVPGVGPKLEGLLKSQGCTSVDDLVNLHHERNHGDAERTKAWLMDVVGIKTRTTVKGIVDYLAEQRTKAASPSLANYAGALVGGGAGAASTNEAAVLGVLQNYSSLTPDRLFKMLQTGGRFSESQSSLTSILRSLVADGKVEEERGTYRFISKAGSRAGTPTSARSPSPTMRASPSAPAYRPPAPSAAPTGGNGASSSEETTVLKVLQNYAGLTSERLSTMLRSSKQSVGNLNGILSSLVSSGKVQNDNGTYRYVSSGGRAGTPTAVRSVSPVRASAPAYKPAASAAPSGGSGASNSEETTVLKVLQNYAGLTSDRLSTMLRSSKQSVGNLNGILSSLVSSGKVQNDNGTYRYVSSGGRAGTPTAVRSVSPVRASAPASKPAASAAPSGGSGASNSEETTVLKVLQNYAGLTSDRLSTMLRSSKQSVGNLNGILSSLVSSGKVQNDNGTYRYVGSGGRAGTPAAVRNSVSPARTSAPAYKPAASASSGPGSGASGGEEAAVLKVLQNYAGLTSDRLSTMLRSSKQSVGNLSGVLSSLVSSGKVQNDNGTYRYVSSGGRAGTPTAVRSVSPARTSAPAFKPAASTAAASGPGSGASGTDESVVLKVLQNYSGLTSDRLAGMLRASGKSVSNQSGVLNSLVSAGKVQNDSGTYRYVSTGGRAGTPMPSRSVSPVSSRSSTPVRAPARSASASSGSGSGAAAGDELTVLSLMQNYSGLTAERMDKMLKSSRKSVNNLSGVLSSLVSKGKVENDKGTYKFLSK